MMTKQGNTPNSVYQMPSGLLRVDHNLTITRANRKATNIASTRGRDLVGSNIINVYPMLASHELSLRNTLSSTRALAINCTQTMSCSAKYYRVSCFISADDDKSMTIRIDHLPKPVVKARQAHVSGHLLSLLELETPFASK